MNDLKIEKLKQKNKKDMSKCPKCNADTVFAGLTSGCHSYRVACTKCKWEEIR